MVAGAQAPVPPATFFDGHSTIRHVVELAISDEAQLLRMSGPTLGEDHFWPLADIREHRDQALRGGAVFGCPQESEARLTVMGEAYLDAMRKHCPNLRKRDRAPGAFRKTTLWLGAAVTSVVLIVFVIIPGLSDQLAEVLPVEQEIALGNTVMRQMERFLGSERTGDIVCSSPEGDIALRKMAARLSDQIDSPYEMRIRVLDNDMINAFAVPGGNIVIIDGLLQTADGPEMVAGVLAHEFGHVVNRDSTRLMLRTAGSAGIIGLLLGDFIGGTALLLVGDQMLTASYQQDAEAGADRFAHRVLADAALPSKPFAGFFRMIQKEYGDVDGILSHLASHPDLEGRAKAAEDANTITGDFKPILTDAEWVALRNICHPYQGDRRSYLDDWRDEPPLSPIKARASPQSPSE